MMLSRISITAIALAGFSYAAPVQAQSLSDRFHAFVDSVVRDTKRNNCWPEPFVRPDRYAVRAPFAVMVHNGWRRQNLLSDQHFDETTSRLNESGEIKVRWILTQAPVQHRTIYVRRALRDELTDARVENVHEYAMQVVRGDQLPAIAVTDIDPTGWPAANVDAIDRKWRESAPEPRLPEPQNTSAPM
jgi:hypothetical protein